MLLLHDRYLGAVDDLEKIADRMVQYHLKSPMALGIWDRLDDALEILCPLKRKFKNCRVGKSYD